MPTQKISKQEILDRLLEHLYLHGYYATSLQDLSKAVGLGKAGLLHHFGNKEGLMRATLQHALKFYHAYILKIVHEDSSFEARFEKLLDRQLKLAQIEQRGCFFANTIMETNQAPVFATELQQFFIDWSKAVEQLLQERLPAAAAKELSYRMFIEYQGSIVLFKMDRDQRHMDRFKTRMLNQLQSALTLHPAI
ncbi:MAG: TetR/AcrR family transcriptional regulator [Bacteroidota bacterium]